MNLATITHVLVALVAAACAWSFQDNRYTAQLLEQQLEFKNTELASVAQVRGAERGINKTYQEALNAARTHEIVLRRNVELARSESDSLRDQSAEAARRIASAPPAAIVEYATTLGGLFTDCSREYQGMAGKASGHAADVQMMLDSWPVIK